VFLLRSVLVVSDRFPVRLFIGRVESRRAPARGSARLRAPIASDRGPAGSACGDADAMTVRVGEHAEGRPVLPDAQCCTGIGHPMVRRPAQLISLAAPKPGPTWRARASGVSWVFRRRCTGNLAPLSLGRAMPKGYPSEFRRRVLDLLEAGRSVAEGARPRDPQPDDLRLAPPGGDRQRPSGRPHQHRDHDRAAVARRAMELLREGAPPKTLRAERADRRRGAACPGRRPGARGIGVGLLRMEVSTSTPGACCRSAGAA
jgi:transposase